MNSVLEFISMIVIFLIGYYIGTLISRIIKDQWSKKYYKRRINGR